MSDAPLYIARDTSSDIGFTRVDGTDNSFITCFDHAVPAGMEQEIEALYENIFSSYSHFKAYGGLTTDTCTYVARDGEAITAIFLFRKLRGSIVVLNEGMKLKDRAIADFANYVFARWPDVSIITFHAIQSQASGIGYSMQRHECTAQVALSLPESEQVYLEGLGKNLRRNIRRYLKAIQKDFPAFRFQVYGPREISDEYLRAIFELSRGRIGSLNKSFALDDEAEKIFSLAKLAGWVGVATIDGQVVGGMIGFRTGGTYFAKVLGHHPDYKGYSLGILCCYLMISECIKHSLKEFNFMWNEYPYKAALGGRRVSLERLVIYRSRLHMLRHGRFAFHIALSGWRYRMSSLLDREDMQESLSPLERAQLRALLWMRRCRRRLSRKAHIQQSFS